MAKGWSLFFGAVLLACFLSLVISPFVGWWLPKNVASFGGDIDFLFYVILFLTGFFFILTEALLVWFMWKYAYDPHRKASYTQGNHRLEVLWTVIPSIILLYIAFAQVPAWARMKSAEPASWFIWGSFKMKGVEPDQVIQVTARQWEWRMRYPGDGLRGTNKDGTKLDDAQLRGWGDTLAIDDLHGVNTIHTWKGANVRVYLKTLDVIHSFFMPNFRFKQDALPGRTIAIWFQPIESNTKPDTWELEPGKEWEIACAELCGGRHYAMRGLIYVHESKDDYEKWVAASKKAQNSHEPEPKRKPAETGN